MSRLRRLLRWAFLLSLAGLVVGGIAFGLLYASVASRLPDVDTLRHVELQEPLYVYAADGRLMGLFGETRRYPVKIAQVPQHLKQAFMAIEDARFYEHGGVDYKGVGRAVWQLLTTDRDRVAGGSTITQQVARQFFLSSEYSYSRKFAEMLLARKMEQELTKDQIFELYLNKSFFGNRAYGVGAAAEFYYGKRLDQLSLDEMASLAAIPKFPSTGNPLSNPERAKIRRDYVLQRMRELKMITPAEEQSAQAAPMHATPHERPVEVYAPYVAEMVRQEMVERYGKEALTKGYHVTTTIDPVLQAAADAAVRDGLGTYDHRHGWNPKSMPHLDLAAGEDATAAATRLRAFPTQGELHAALVLGTSGTNAQVVLADGTVLDLGPDASRWTGKPPGALLKRGDVTRVRKLVPEAKTAATDAKPGEPAAAPAPTGPVTWRLDQLPRAESALVSLDADTGALRAIVGGYSFAGSKFNNATQARRQPGSSFKPFVYAAAFERGYNPASIVLDAPVVFRMRGGKVWRPQNDGGGFAGPVRVRQALVQSRNLVSVRMLDAIGVDYARKYITQFGFKEEELPPNLSIALGTPSLTPLSIARGYAAFANGGFRIDPWFIREVKDREGKVIFTMKPAIACRTCGQGAAGQPLAPTSTVVDGFDLGPAGGAADKSDPKDKKGPKVTTAKPAETPATLPADAVLAPRAIDERIAYQLVSMMRDVVLHGTATDARRIGRDDIGGKTGSTNDHRDAWFSGTGGNLITTVWVGKSDNSSLGYREYGGKAALPIWIDYMQKALKDVPIAPNEPPPGMVKVTVTAGGQLLPTNGTGGIIEYVKVEDLEKMETYVEDYGAEDAVPSEESFDIF